MDLSKKKPLSTKEKMDLSRDMQIMVLDEIAAKGKPGPDSLIFHGGTSISTTHGSARWSEDLDFVITPDLMKSLGQLRARVEKSLNLRMKTLYPGSKIELQDKTETDAGNPKIGEVDRWLMRWEHPNRIGAVRVKVEFFVTEPSRMPLYSVRIATPRSLSVMATASLPTADLTSLWADKILAISARPAIKWRDMYDLAYLSEAMSASGIDRTNALDQMKTSADIYNSNVGNIRAGLDNDMVVEALGNTAEFELDMKKWFTEADFKKMQKAGVFEDYLRRAADEIQNARNIIDGDAPGCDGP